MLMLLGRWWSSVSPPTPAFRLPAHAFTFGALSTRSSTLANALRDGVNRVRSGMGADLRCRRGSAIVVLGEEEDGARW